jgi:hypothetical protein
MGKERRFPALRLVLAFLRILGGLTIVGAVVSGVALIVHRSPDTGQHDLIAAGVGATVGGMVCAIFEFAAAEAIALGLAIERNTRRDAALTKVCPSCAEPIREAARVCPHCRADVTSAAPARDGRRVPPAWDGHRRIGPDSPETVVKPDMDIVHDGAPPVVDVRDSVEALNTETAEYQETTGRHWRNHG